MSTLSLPSDTEERFGVHVGEGLRARTTVRETAAEYARYRRLSETGPLPLKQGTLLAVFAEMAQLPGADPVPMTVGLSKQVCEAYIDTYGTQPPYNWTGEIANPRDLTSTPAGP